jgi:pimeloyl-ACP methyl ester carboxylesterase
MAALIARTAVFAGAMAWLAIAWLAMAASPARAQAALTEFFVGKPPYQMYVQHWRARAGAPAKPAPVVMIHGGVHTGIAWTTTPDGQAGWAQQFAERGWNVYVVDWPGVGRSGFWPETLNTGAGDVASALGALLERIGPAVLVGHSIGGALSFKVAERSPEKVRAIAALAPASMETVSTAVPSAPLDKAVIASREAALQRFANSDKFPKASFDNYFSSLIPYSPRIRNAAVGTNDELKIDRSRLDTWKRVPVLFLTAEDDRTVPTALSQQTAQLMGVQHVALGKDWGMPGHAHLFIVEQGQQEIGRKVEDWILKTLAAK